MAASTNATPTDSRIGALGVIFRLTFRVVSCSFKVSSFVSVYSILLAEYLGSPSGLTAILSLAVRISCLVCSSMLCDSVDLFLSRVYSTWHPYLEECKSVVAEICEYKPCRLERHSEADPLEAC